MLWKDNFRNIVRYSPTQALNFAFKNYFQNQLAKKGSSTHKFAKNVAAGSIAGSISLVFLYPLDFARNMLCRRREKFNGLRNIFEKTLKSDGLSGLYRGFGISLLSIAIYRGLYFGLYDSAKPSLPSSVRNNFFVNFMLGWATTTCSGICSYPIDTIRRRMMMVPNEKYHSSIQCAADILENEGMRSFFRGAGANSSRGIAGGACLALFDQLHRQLFDGGIMQV